MKDEYFKRVCEDFDIVLFGDNAFLNEDTLNGFEQYLNKWYKKVEDIKEKIRNQRQEEKFSKLSDDELLKTYKDVQSFDPIGTLYANIKSEDMYYLRREITKRGLNLGNLI